jgi:Xaa-Pro dipeptidase
MTVFERRRNRAAELLRRAGIGAAAFVPGPNFAYLTGVHLHLMERPTLFIVTADGDGLAMMPVLERQKWQAAMPDFPTLYWDDADGPAAAFAGIAERIGRDHALGVEGLRMRAVEYLSLAGHLGRDAVVDADAALAALRLCKDEAEIADLRRAIHISEAALGETLDAGIKGQTEAAIMARLKMAMLAHGATGFAFDPIVLAGENAANPHGQPGDRIVAPGDALLIDFGASFGDMHADITRTQFCSHVSETHAAIHATVLRANESGRSMVRAGVPVGDVDAAATDVLLASPFADMVLHKTGHGLGREIHEAPQVMRQNRQPQETGMVFTVEPGLYRPGEIGVRIEDNVLVTDTGRECLTSFSRKVSSYA